jgi:uncharacterized SAM-binding protein YcdF (DUF218 family)
MDVTTTRIIESLTLPPGGLLLLAFIGLILWKIGLGRRLFVLALLLLWLFSLPITAGLLMAGLERYPALEKQGLAAQEAQAIVVLGGGRYLDAPEYEGDTLNQRGFYRLRYAAKLAKATGLPVIPSGGTIQRGKAEAVIAAKILREEFGVEVEHLEQRSQTTWENARYTAQLMKKEGINKILLVTEAFHMPRAMHSFKRNGIDPIPAPTHFKYVPYEHYALSDILPAAKALAYSADALHEYLGLTWYRMK